MPRSAIVCFILVLLSSCNAFDKEPRLEDDVKGGLARLKDLRGDFLFTVYPETGTATGLFRFSRSANGFGISLPATQLFVDRKEVKADSTEMTGVFYEVQLPLSDFYTDHVIEFITVEKAVHSEKFKAEQFVVSPYPGVVPVADLDIQVSGVADKESVTVVMVDTVFDNNDLNQRYEVSNGLVKVKGAELQTLSQGPITAEVIYERKILTKVLPLRRGQITIRQSAKGEFELK